MFGWGVRADLEEELDALDGRDGRLGDGRRDAALDEGGQEGALLRATNDAELVVACEAR